MPDRIYTSHEIEDTLEAYLGGRHTGRALYLAVVALVLAALVALPLVRVEETVSAPGVLRPVVERHEVRSLVTGRVADVHVLLDQRVEMGSRLVSIAGEDLELRVRLAGDRAAEAGSAAGDLRALLARDSLLGAATLRSPRIRAERDELIERWREQALRIGRAEAEAQRVRHLAARDLVPRQDLERVEGELQLAMAAADLLIGAQKARWSAALAALEEEQDALAAELRQLEVERGRLSIAAPVTGTVEELRVLSRGSIVQAGEVVAVISPEASLIAEALVSPRDIGAVGVGQPVRLHVDAFDYRDWGHLEGRVRAVSQDYLMAGEAPAFRTQIVLSSAALRLPNGTEADLRKGMTLRARFRVAERSLLRILRGGVEARLHPWQTPDPVPAATP